MDEIKDVIFETIEASLDAQLRAIQRLRKGGEAPPKVRQHRSMSQIAMVYDVLKEAQSPLHVVELIARVKASFGVSIDRESIVSSLTKKINRGDRFVRTGKNTFGLRPEDC